MASVLGKCHCMLFKGIPKIRPRSIHPAGELQDKYLFIWKVQIKMQKCAIHSAMVRFLPGTADQATILRTNRLQKISLFRFSIRKKEKSLQSILERDYEIFSVNSKMKM